MCAFASRGDVWAKRRVVAVVFAEEVREMGGAPRPGMPGMPGMPASFFGTGESLRADKDAGTRPPPEPVLLIDSPPTFSDVLPGTGDGAFDFDAPTFRICART